MTVTITRTPLMSHNVNVTLDTGTKAFQNYTIHVNPNTPHGIRPATSTGDVINKQPVNLLRGITATRIVKRDHYPATWAQYAVEYYSNDTWSFLYPLGMGSALPMIPATRPYDSILYYDSTTRIYTLLMLCDNSIIRRFRTSSTLPFGEYSSSTQPAHSGVAVRYHYGDNYDGDPASIRSLNRFTTIMHPELTDSLDYVLFLRSLLLYPLEPLKHDGDIPNDVRFISLHICTDTTIQVLLASPHTVYSMLFRLDHSLMIPKTPLYPLLSVTGANIVQI